MEEICLALITPKAYKYPSKYVPVSINLLTGIFKGAVVDGYVTAEICEHYCFSSLLRAVSTRQENAIYQVYDLTPDIMKQFDLQFAIVIKYDSSNIELTLQNGECYSIMNSKFYIYSHVECAHLLNVLDRCNNAMMYVYLLGNDIIHINCKYNVNITDVNRDYVLNVTKSTNQFVTGKLTEEAIHKLSKGKDGLLNQDEINKFISIFDTDIDVLPEPIL